MIEAAVPCHKTHAVFHIPEANYLGSFAPVSEPAAADPAEEVRRALAYPIGSVPLSMLAKRAKNCVIICSDHTRPVPSRYIIPAMLEELRRLPHMAAWPAVLRKKPDAAMRKVIRRKISFFGSAGKA